MWQKRVWRMQYGQFCCVSCFVLYGEKPKKTWIFDFSMEVFEIQTKCVLIFLWLSCSLVFWYELNEKQWNILLCLSGNRHGSCMDDDLQNWLNTISPENLYNNNTIWPSFFSDIDECDLQIDNCVQVCVNTAPNFDCSCNAGFTLDDDGISCNGKFKIYFELNSLPPELSLKKNTWKHMPKQIKLYFLSFLL